MTTIDIIKNKEAVRKSEIRPLRKHLVPRHVTCADDKKTSKRLRKSTSPLSL